MASSRTESGSTGESTGRKIFTRTFDAPRSLVFRAWTDPEHLARWWGPHGFTNPVCEVDARPGGHIRIDMTAPNGFVYPMKGTFREVIEPDRLVFTSGEAPFEILNTVTFAEHDGKTTLTLEAVFLEATPDMAQAVAGMEAGLTQSLERLEAELAKAGADSEFTITRDFEAPRDLVFKAWTEADHLARWFGPKGFTMLSCNLELRPGGVFHYGMRSPDGRDLWGRWVFREVATPERIVFVASFSDEKGGVTRHPFATDWPLEVLSTVTFTERDGRTTLTMRGVPINATPSESRTFLASHEGMQKGWTGTLDQLEAHLANP